MKKFGIYILILALTFAAVIGMMFTKGLTTTGVLLFALFLLILTTYRVMALGIEAKDAKGNRLIMLLALVAFYGIRYATLDEREALYWIAAGLILYAVYDAIRVYRILQSKAGR